MREKRWWKGRWKKIKKESSSDAHLCFVVKRKSYALEKYKYSWEEMKDFFFNF